MLNIQSSKALLRLEIKEKLMKLSKHEKQLQSISVHEMLFNNQSFHESNRISIYLSTNNEIDTKPILKRIFELNKECFVPRYDKNVMEMVKLRNMDDFNELPLTKWNIKQPNLDEKRENALESGGLDLIIVPGVAFTTDGHRLGHGKGYYDTFLEKLKNNPITIGLAFNEQIVSAIPLSDHDMKLDSVFYCKM